MTKERRFFSNPELPSRAAMADALKSNDTSALSEMVIGVALEDEDLNYAEGLCLQLAQHADENVRGNAVLGLGHLSRRFKRISAPSLSVIGVSLADPSEYVRGHAWSAASDVYHFLKIKVDGFRPS